MNLERLELRSDDTAKSNLHKLAELFPSCIVECRSADDACKTELALDLDKLQALVGRSISSGSDSGAGVGAGTGSGRERYEFTWVGKDQARLEALRPIARTLLPVTERSVDFATTQNLYVEGDNLEALKLLQRSYSGAVKMIYVDPPYNTGTDFVYRDDFALSAKDYDALSGAVDDKGQRYFRNSDTSGRYHSAWCSMMYSRLLLARSFLTRDGVIFISIDDHEVHNLRKICDEIFGERNFMAELIWQRAYSPKNDAKGVSQSHDYVLMYVRDISVFKIGRLPRNEKVNRRYQNKDNDPRGVWKSSDLSVKTYSKANDYEVTLPSGRKVRPPAGRCWSVSAREYERLVADNRIYFGNKGDSSPSLKRFLSELKTDGLAPTSLLFYSDVGHSQEGAQELKALMNAGVFDGPKPTRLIRHLMCLANLNPQGGDIVMDFFSGSASTADAVLQQNLEDGGNRRFIMVQYPESVDTESTAAQAGFTTICEIGEERIRRAAAALSAKAKQCTKIVHGGGG